MATFFSQSTKAYNRTLSWSSKDDLYVFINDWGSYTILSSSGINEVDLTAVLVPLTINLVSSSGHEVEDSLGNTINWANNTILNIFAGQASDTIYGNSGNNRIEGRGGSDSIYAAGGNDILLGGEGNDTLDGGAGNDTYIFELDWGIDNLTDISGTDTLDFRLLSVSVIANLISSSEDEVIQGINTINFTDLIENVIGGSGNDSIIGNNLSNRLEGGFGNDTLSGGLGNDTLIGGLGNDTYVFSGNFGIDLITEIAGEGNDTIDLSAISSSLNINLSSNGVNPQVSIGGNTVKWSNSEIENLISGDGADIIRGTNASNSLDARGGQDTINAGAGNDIIFGGSGNDSIYGETGNDTINGGRDDDYLNGDMGSDLYVFDNNFGKDTIDDLVMDSVYSDNTADFSALTTSLTIKMAGSVSYDEVTDSNGNTVNWAATNVISKIIGSQTTDTITGNQFNNWFDGYFGNDIYKSFLNSFGTDTIQDSAGEDILDLTQYYHYVSGLTDATITRQSTNLIIDIKNKVSPTTGSGRIIINNQYADGISNTPGSNHIEHILFANKQYIPNNSAPSEIDGSLSSIDENSSNGISLGSLLGVDAEVQDSFTYEGKTYYFDSLTYSLTDNAGGRFNIDSNIGEVKIANGLLLDYETNSSHDITVRVTDSYGLSFDKVITVDVNDINEIPTAINSTTLSVEENSSNGINVGTFTGKDQDFGDVLTYTLTNDAGGRFAIDKDTGVLSVANGLLLDYESAKTHDITVRVTDKGNLFLDKNFTVNLVDVNEIPTSINANLSIIPDTSKNGTVVGTAIGTDQDFGDVLTYTLTNDAGGRFAIDSKTGVITVADSSLLDYGISSFHNITVRVTDKGNLFIESEYAVDLTDPAEIQSVSISAPQSLNLNGIQFDAQRFNSSNVNSLFDSVLSPQLALDIDGASSKNWEATFVVKDLDNQINGIKDNIKSIGSDYFEYYVNGTKLTSVNSISYEDSSTIGSGLNVGEYRVRIDFNPGDNGLNLSIGDKVDIDVTVADDYGYSSDYATKAVDISSLPGELNNKFQYTFWVDDNKNGVFEDNEQTQTFTYLYSGGAIIDQDINRFVYSFMEGQSYDMKVKLDQFDSSDTIINTITDLDTFRINSLPKYTGTTVALDAVLNDGGNGNVNISPNSNTWTTEVNFQSEFGNVSYIRISIDANQNGEFNEFVSEYFITPTPSGTYQLNIDAGTLGLIDGETYVMRAEVYVQDKGFEYSGYANDEFVFSSSPDIIVNGTPSSDNLVVDLDAVSSGGANEYNIVFDGSPWTALVSSKSLFSESNLNYQYWIDSDRNGIWDNYEKVDLGTGSVSGGQIQIDPNSLSSSLVKGHGYRMQVLVTDTITNEKQYAFDTFMVGSKADSPKLSLDAVDGDSYNNVFTNESWTAKANTYSGLASINSYDFYVDSKQDGSFDQFLGNSTNGSLNISSGTFAANTYQMKIVAKDTGNNEYYSYDSFRVNLPGEAKIAVSLDAVEGNDTNFIKSTDDFSLDVNVQTSGGAVIDHYEYYIDKDNNGSYETLLGTSVDSGFTVKNNGLEQGNYNVQVKVFDTTGDYSQATSSLTVDGTGPEYYVFLFLEYSNIDDFDRFEYYQDATGTPGIIDVNDESLGTITLTHPSPGVAGIQLPAPGGASVDPSANGTKITFIDPILREAGATFNYDVKVYLMDGNSFVTQLGIYLDDPITNMLVSLDAVDVDNFNFLELPNMEFSAKANAISGNGVVIDHYEFYYDSDFNGTYDQFLGSSTNGILNTLNSSSFAAGTYNMQVKVFDTNSNVYTAINSFTINGTDQPRLEVSLDSVDNNAYNFVAIGEDFTTKTLVNPIGGVSVVQYDFYLDSDNDGSYDTFLGTSNDGTLAIDNTYSSGTYKMQVKVLGNDAQEYFAYNSFTVQSIELPGIVGGVNFDANPNPVVTGEAYSISYASATDIDGKVNHSLSIDPNMGLGYVSLGDSFDVGGIGALKANVAFGEILLVPGEKYIIHTDITDTDGVGLITNDKFVFVRNDFTASPIQVNLDSVANDSNNANSLVDFINAGQDWSMSATALSHEAGDVNQSVAIDKFDFWLDLNRDGVFDSNEFIGSASAVGNSASINVDHTLFSLDADKRYLSKVLATDINGKTNIDYDALQTLAPQYTNDYVKVNLDAVINDGTLGANVNLILNGTDWVAKANAISNSTGNSSNNGIEKYEFFIDTDETAGTNWVQVLDDNNPLLDYSTTGEIKVSNAQFNSLSSGSTYNMKVIVYDKNSNQNSTINSFTITNDITSTAIQIDAWADNIQFPKSGVNEFEWFNQEYWTSLGPVWNVGINANLSSGQSVLQYKLWIDENGNSVFDSGEYSQTISPISIGLDAVSGGNVISTEVNVANTNEDWTATASVNAVSGINIEKYEFWIDANKNGVYENTELIGESLSGDINFGSISVDHTLFNFSDGQQYNMKVSAFDSIGGVTSSIDTFIAGIQNTNDYQFLNVDAVKGSDYNYVNYGEDWTISAKAVADSSRTIVRYEFWIDANQDGGFDGGESIGFSASGDIVLDHTRFDLKEGQTYKILSHAITQKGSTGNWTDFSYTTSIDSLTIGSAINSNNLQINRKEMNLSDLPNASGTYTMYLDTTITDGISNYQSTATDTFETEFNPQYSRLDLDAVKNDGSLNSQINLVEAGSNWIISAPTQSNINWTTHEYRFWIDANNDGKYTDASEELYWENWNRSGEITVQVLNYDSGNNLLTLKGRYGDVQLDLNTSTDYTINTLLYQNATTLNRADNIHFTPRVIDGFDSVTNSSSSSNNVTNSISAGTSLSSVFNITDPNNRIQDFQFQIIDRDTNQILYTSADLGDSATLQSAINSFDTSTLSQGNYQLKLLLTNDINIQSHQESNFLILPMPNATPTLLGLDPVHSTNPLDPIVQSDNNIGQNDEFNMFVKVDNPNGEMLRYDFFIDLDQNGITDFANWEDVHIIFSSSSDGAIVNFNSTLFDLAPGNYNAAVFVRNADTYGEIGRLGNSFSNGVGIYYFTIYSGQLLEGDSDANILIGTSDADILIGGLGNDTLQGGAAGDFYKGFISNFGNDIIDDTSGSNDILDLKTSNFADVASWLGIDSNSDNAVDQLLITFNSGDSIAIENYFDNSNLDPDLALAGSGHIENILFGDHAPLDLAGVQALIV